jgi:hypothetical protein
MNLQGSMNLRWIWPRLWGRAFALKANGREEYVTTEIAPGQTAITGAGPVWNVIVETVVHPLANRCHAWRALPPVNYQT